MEKNWILNITLYKEAKMSKKKIIIVTHRYNLILLI